MTRAVVAIAVATAIVSLFVACNEEFHFDVPRGVVEDGGSTLDAGGDAASPSPPDAAKGCRSDVECAAGRCDVASGVCVGCLGDSDCTTTAWPHCEPTRHVCVPCLVRADCGKRQQCDAVTNRCLDGCFDTDDPCSTKSFVCDGDLGLCVECKTSANCTESANGRICDIPIGRCVQCTGNAQCPSEKPVCDRRSGSCEVCVVATSCDAGEACDPTSLTCVPEP